MKKEGFLRGIMLVAGFIAAVGILCSQPLYKSTEKAKASTEQSDSKGTETFIQAPADAIPGHSVQVDDSSVYHLIASCFDSTEETEMPPVIAVELGQFLKVLFRTIIAPNAP